MKIKNIKLGIFFVVIFLGSISCIEAEEALENLAATETTIAINSTRYVAGYGDDANDCLSSENPCLTIQGAFEKTVMYDHPTFYLLEFGTFDLPVDPSESELREINRSVTIIGTGDQYFPSSHRIMIRNGAYVVLENVNSFSTIYADSGSLILRNTQINGGNAPGIHTNGDELIIENSYITANTGGGIVTGLETVTTITGSYIGENGGVGIRNDGRMTVTETRVSGNRNFVDGDVIHKTAGIENNGHLDVERSLIDNNNGIYAIYNHPGVYDNPTPTLTLTNSTVSGNQATSSESAIIYNQGHMEVIYSTVAENTGLGILVSSSAEETRIVNSLIANNSGENCDFSAQPPVLEGNNLDSDHSCFPDFSADPSDVARYLDSLKNNGGPTMTHALFPASPAIDTADGLCPEKDQRNVDRPFGTECDVGAYEYNLPRLNLPSASLSCDGIQGVSIREDGQMRTNVKVPGALGEYNATLNDFQINCISYEAYPDTLLCDSPKPAGNTYATLIIFDEQGNQFCNETFTVPGGDVSEPKGGEGCNLSVQICSSQGLSFDENKCECVQIQ